MEFFQTSISQEAIDRAVKVLKSGWISEGRLVKEFEEKLSQSLGFINPVALNSGTSALHLALVISRIEPGDEVIIPAQTFVATGLAVLMQRAVPVFADIQCETGNIAPESFRKKITKKTKAVIPVHWGGYPCDLDEIALIAAKNKIIVIEDAAHALGASYREKAIGSISRFTAFSFQAIKHLTTGDGGALCCFRDDDCRRGRLLRWFGIDRLNSKPSLLGERQYDICECGYKYHLNDIGAAIGLGNLEDLNKNLLRRRAIAVRYINAFKNIPGLRLLNYKNDRRSSYWIFTILVERREDFISALKGHGVPASVVHLRIDRNSIFGGIKEELAGQEKFERMQVSLPVHQGLFDEDVERVIKSVKAGW